MLKAEISECRLFVFQFILYCLVDLMFTVPIIWNPAVSAMIDLLDIIHHQKYIIKITL
jgi:hypothetical protein